MVRRFEVLGISILEASSSIRAHMLLFIVWASGVVGPGFWAKGYPSFGLQSFGHSGVEVVGFRAGLWGNPSSGGSGVYSQNPINPKRCRLKAIWILL